MAVEMGNRSQRKDLTLFEFIDEYCRGTRLLGKSPSTYSQLLKTLARIEEMLGRTSTVRDLGNELVSRYKIFLKARGNAASTIRRAAFELKRIWSWAFIQGFTLADPKDDGVPCETSASMPLLKFYRKIYVPQRLITASLHTRTAYETIIGRLNRTWGRPVLLADLSREFQRTMIQEMTSNGLSPGTIKSTMVSLRCIWREAVEEGIITTLPPRLGIKEIIRIKPAWNVQQVGKILQSAAQECGEIEGIPAGTWWVALLLVCYDCGARKRVIMRTPLSSVMWDDCAIHFPGELQKQRRDQYSAVSQRTMEILKGIRDPDRSLLFPWPFDKGNRTTFPALDRKFKEILSRADIGWKPSDWRNGLFHRLRRTRASYGERAIPGSATEDLGHSSRAVTQRYLDPSIVGCHRTVDHIPRPEF
jgi:integrase